MNQEGSRLSFNLSVPNVFVALILISYNSKVPKTIIQRHINSGILKV
jgi:hypothetical protein